MRFSVECAFPHLGKRGATSWKSALCHLRLTESRTLPPPDRADCAFPSRCGARGVWGNPPPGCGALWRMAQLGKCARATPRQTAGRVARGSADLGLSLASRKSALCPTGGFRMRLSVTSRRPGCGATARQAAGRVVPSSRNGDDHVCDRPRPSCTSTRPLKSCGFVQTTATRVQTLTQEVPFSIAR